MFSHKIDANLELRLLAKHHAQELFSLADKNRSYLRQWMSWLDTTKEVSAIEKFIETTLKQFADNNGFQTGIWFENKIVGVIGFHAIDWTNKKTTVGYWLSADYQGRGIMTKACRAYIDYALKELKLNRVEIRCAVENKKSRAVPERLKLKQEGIARQNEWLYDHSVDHAVYSTIASEWT